VRKLANEKGVDLTTVSGTGVGGRIRKQDVLAAAAAKQAPIGRRPQPPPHAAPAAPAAARTDLAHLRGTTEPMSRLRKVIASAWSSRWRLSAVDDRRRGRRHPDRVAAQPREERVLAREGVKLSFMPFFAKAACEALKQFPTRQRQHGHGRRHGHLPRGEHLGVAVDTDRGLLVPVIRMPGTSTSPASHARSRTWPSAPAPTR
jgi:pyruvate dehydrogenase E2 component (dihydrolipoamide acetyltransferase)